MRVKPGSHAGKVLVELNRRDEPLLLSAGQTKKSPAFRINSILVPIDFSDCSRKALQYAAALAKEHESALTLVYVVPTYYVVGEYGGIEYPMLASGLRAGAAKELARLVLDEIKGEVPADTRVVIGNPAYHITDLARTLPADLIVISTHGRTGLKHVLLGSVAEHVIRHAPCPVMVVREKEREILAT